MNSCPPCLFSNQLSEGSLAACRVRQDMIELSEACKDIAGLFERNGLANIVRGALLASSLAMDAHFASAVSTVSPLFKLPVDAVQRGRDHGEPTLLFVLFLYRLDLFCFVSFRFTLIGLFCFVFCCLVFFLIVFACFVRSFFVAKKRKSKESQHYEQRLITFVSKEPQHYKEGMTTLQADAFTLSLQRRRSMFLVHRRVLGSVTSTRSMRHARSLTYRAMFFFP